MCKKHRLKLVSTRKHTYLFRCDNCRSGISFNKMIVRNAILGLWPIPEAWGETW